MELKWKNWKGELDEEYRATFLHDKLPGTFICGYETINGFQKEYQQEYQHGILHGILHGKQTKWDEYGDLESEGYFQNGEKHGLWIRYWESRIKDSVETYFMGKLNGEATDWSYDGNLIRKCYYNMGTKIGT